MSSQSFSVHNPPDRLSRLWRPSNFYTDKYDLYLVTLRASHWWERPFWGDQVPDNPQWMANEDIATAVRKVAIEITSGRVPLDTVLGIYDFEGAFHVGHSAICLAAQAFKLVQEERRSVADVSVITGLTEGQINSMLNASAW